MLFVVGKSALTLSDPWKFHTGDDPEWAMPSYDDESWETISLKAAPGAHDGDVGLTGYVPGWTARGHHGYSGYAWYRIQVRIAGDDDSLGIAGPTYVDDAYQLFVNGHLLGGVGDFSGHAPSAYSTTPTLFPLPTDVRGAAKERPVLIALRVWMAPESAAGGPDVGGIHIAPVIGALGAVAARYHVEWMELIRGYFLEILQAAVFFALAAFALGLGQLDRGTGYGWMAAGLISTGTMRALLAVGAWTSWINARHFDLLENGIVIPAMIGTWTLAWWRVGDRRPAWLGRLIVTAASALAAATVLDNPLVLGASTAWGVIGQAARLALAAAYVTAGGECLRRRGSDRGLVGVSALLIGIGLFASELSALRVPGIWFPYRTGVSRTQFSYAAADVALALWFWLRLRSLSDRSPRRT